ncbi:DUF4304 domain-containing protein [Catellatospora coxensis]|uniref:DUF4304 domain-containing protein n=1 Tax=Catellatospora coxensis TaxID=310354 RepID=A0A8J3L525_9ACTN|nr:DUF4304 domain-containing protein [Catellatospora coxensis]GIG11609.1 hypothetical protein Cco03nite_83090 [Catellatospora coxensis]
MQRTIRQAYLDMIKSQLAPLLRAHGFARSSGTFRRFDAEGDATLLDVQGSTGSGRHASLFYVNVGVSTSRWLLFREAQYADPRMRTHATATTAQWWARLRVPQQLVGGPDLGSGDCWSISAVEDAEACGTALCEVVKRDFLPAATAWVAQYHALEHAVLSGAEDDITRLASNPPATSPQGIDLLRRITDDGHFYAQWLRHGTLP